ncbi:MAG: AI-2E family transporter [Mycobacteriales bacterium]|nr:AI-2E family transporter [Frankia sp.]
MPARARRTQIASNAVDIAPQSIAVFLTCFVVVVAVTALVHAATRTTTVLVIGTLLALALNPLVELAERRLRRSRAASVAIVLAAVALLTVALAVLLVPPAVAQARGLRDELPRVVNQLGDLPFVGDRLARDNVPARVQHTLESLPDRLRASDSPVSGVLSSLAAGLSTGVVVLVLASALLVDGPRLVRAARRVVPRPRRELADRLGTVAYNAIGRYVAGSLLVAGLAGLSTLAVGLVLHVPLAPLLAVNVMVFDLVPQIGGAAGGIPFVVMGFTHSATTGVLCAVFFILYLQLENNVLSPLIVGQAVQLSPPATMAAALIGVAAGGVVGALIAVPVTGAAKLLYLELRPPPGS